MAMVKLSEAAELAGRSKPTLLRAIQSGRLSATRNDIGEWLIDTAELNRVYEIVARTDTRAGTLKRGVAADVTVLQRENELLQQQIELLKSERNDLRRRLDDEAAERRKLTALLTHQPEVSPKDEPKESKLLQKLFGNRRQGD